MSRLKAQDTESAAWSRIISGSLSASVRCCVNHVAERENWDCRIEVPPLFYALAGEPPLHEPTAAAANNVRLPIVAPVVLLGTAA